LSILKVKLKKNLIKSLVHAFTLSSGWRRRGIAFTAGAIGALSLPPFEFFPALIITMTAAVWLIDGSVSIRHAVGIKARLSTAFEAAKDGYWLGLGFFIAGLWWLGAAFLVEADRFAWAIPLGVIGLPAVLSLFFALGFVAARLMWSTGAQRVCALAAGLALAEWLRSVLFTGFPWNIVGMSLGAVPSTAQGAAFVGLHGLTVIAILIAAAPATLIDRERPALSIRPTLFACAAFACLVAGGLLRIGQQATPIEPGVRIRIMQPNLAQDKKFQPEAMGEILTKYLSLSDRATSPRYSGISDVTHLIWPESPFPVVLTDDTGSMKKIAGFLPEGAVLVTGAIRSMKTAAMRRPLYMNSVHVINHKGALVASYDKVHLVPFGEYLPLQSALEYLRLRQFVQVPGGFTPGERRAPLRVPGLPLVAPLICYEAIFPGEVTPSSGDRPSLLLNVTNDGWFGVTPGPYQHLAQARLRAIEEGLPLVRAANSGISAIIDPYGRTVGALPLGEEGVLDGPLPTKITATVFSRYPLLSPFLIWLLVFLTALWRLPRDR